MTPLCELCMKYQSDKSPEICHNYTPFYHELLKDKPVKKFLEVGINRGASLRMWRDYFSSAEIFGIDIDSNCLFTEERIHTYQCDASNPLALKNLMIQLGNDFDVILEDASHIVEHQIIAANLLPEFLAPNGIFMVEDAEFPDIVSASIKYSHEIKRLYLPSHVVHPIPHPQNDNIIIINK